MGREDLVSIPFPGFAKFQVEGGNKSRDVLWQVSIPFPGFAKFQASCVVCRCSNCWFQSRFQDSLSFKIDELREGGYSISFVSIPFPGFAKFQD